MVRLELLQDGDFETIAQWNEGKTADFVTQWAGPGYALPLTAEKLKEYNAGYNTPGGSQFIYRIMDDTTNEMIGTVQLLRIDREAGTAVVGRFLIGAENLRGKGMGQEALALITHKGFDEFALNKLALNVYDHNIGAIMCYEKVGYVKAVYKPDAVQSQNGAWGSWHMALDRDRWHTLASIDWRAMS